jgi:hypothetical protein
MVQSLEIELTTADIVILTDLIYEDAPQFWMNGEWYCPPRTRLRNKIAPLIERDHYCPSDNERSATSLAPGNSLA